MKITDATITVLPVSAPEQTKSQTDRQRPALRPGQLIRATVMEQRGQQLTLDMEGHSVTARSDLGVREGQQLLLHVTATSPQIQLQTLGLNTSGQPAAILQLLGAGWDLPSLLRRLQAHKSFKNSPLPDGVRTALQIFTEGPEGASGHIDGSTLSTLLKNLGVNPFEDDGQGGSLRQALALIAGEDPEKDPGLTEIAGRLLQGLDSTLQCNLRSSPGGTLVFPLPLPFLEKGFLVIEHPPGEGGGTTETPAKLSLFLNLKNLGEMRVDMLMDGEELRIKFTCDTEEARRALSSNGEDLQAALRFKPPREVLFTTGDPRPQEELREHCGGEPSGFVNTRI